jgi:hypothetical protein
MSPNTPLPVRFDQDDNQAGFRASGEEEAQSYKDITVLTTSYTSLILGYTKDFYTP